MIRDIERLAAELAELRARLDRLEAEAEAAAEAEADAAPDVGDGAAGALGAGEPTGAEAASS